MSVGLSVCLSAGEDLTCGTLAAHQPVCSTRPLVVQQHPAPSSAQTGSAATTHIYPVIDMIPESPY